MEQALVDYEIMRNGLNELVTFVTILFACGAVSACVYGVYGAIKNTVNKYTTQVLRAKDVKLGDRVV